MKKATGLIILASVVAQVTSSSCAVSDSDKKDCGFAGINESSCLSKGCCWSPAGENSATPWCYFSESSATGYSLSGITETDTGYSGTLTLIGSGTTTYGADIKNLKIDVILESADAIRIKITDADNTRWEIPETVVARSHATSKPASLNYKFTYSESPFAFEITRLSDGVSIFEMDNSFIFKDQYIELSTIINSNAKTFGLGESTRMNHALTSGTTYTGWALDQAALTMNKNLYGSVPFYMQMLDGQAHGAMLFNSNGIDTTLKDTSLTFKTIGGVIDLYIFVGPTPANVVEQYTAIVGRPAMMPYWSLGFHNCKYGYTSVSQVEEVVANYSAAGIPLDTQWMDIDYMQDYKDFTTDSTNFEQVEVEKFIAQLHDNGQHFVPIIDPGIMVADGYDAYEQGVKADIFVKDLNGNNYLGQVWPGPTYFPDFFNPATQSYWTEQLSAFHKIAEADGFWIDMNEVSNFCNTDGTGQVCANTASSGCPAPGASQTDCCLQCTTVDSSNKYDFPPYSIGNSYGKLSTKTMAVSGSHYNNITVYDAHNLYGLTEQIATNKALIDIRGKRPFLLTRSSFMSTGVHSAKWTGDNGATWNDLKSSIISVMDFNMFGIPMVGADICGFIYDTTEELCARWIEVGAFYPFVRNHNALGQIPQEFYLWPNVATAAKNALNIRYQILPYIYTLFYSAHTTGATVARPLWANYPSDTTALSIDRQFMLGSAILISPVLDSGVTSVSAYFPQGYWYDFNTRTLAIDASAAGTYSTLSTPLTSTNVHIKGGSVLPLQEAAMTTTAARLTPFTLVVALCPYGQAWGSLFWDDGEQINLDAYLSVDYHAEVTSTVGTFTGVVNTNSYGDASALTVPSIQVLGVTAAPSSAQLNGVTLSSSQYSFDATTNILTFSSLGLKVSDAFVLVWSV